MPKGYPKPPILPDQVFGRLTILGEGTPRYYAGKVTRLMRCRCVCGNETEVFVSALRKGLTTSCGCLWREQITSHGRSHTRAYSSWEHMRERCKPDYQDARNYSDRGIQVCAEWSGPGGFERFYAEMGDPPPRTSVDRIDNSRGYEPGNCRWATPKQQMHNIRTNVMVMLPGGIPAVLAEACRLTGVARRSVTYRIKHHGETHQEAFDFYLRQIPLFFRK